MSDLGDVFLERLRELVPPDRHGEVELAADLSAGMVSRWKKGTRRANPSLETIAKIAAAAGVPAWSLIGPRDAAAVRENGAPYEAAAEGEFVQVPVLSTPVAAGSPILVMDEYEEETMALRRSWVHRHLSGRPLFVRVARGRWGESMANTILPGDLVLIDTHVEEITQGRIYVVRLPGEEGGVTVKRVYRDGKHLICVSDNQAHAPFVVDVPRGSVLGDLVVGRVRRWMSGEEG